MSDIYWYIKIIDTPRLFDSTTVLIRAEFSVTLFRIHKQLLELKFIHYPVSYGFLPLFDEPVYTMSTFSDFDVARLVKWAYDGEYPEYLDLDSPTRTRMPTSRYSSLDEYLRKQIRTPRISSLNSTINISSDRHLVPCRQKRPTAYNLSQQQQAFITNNFPFLVHLRMYVLASLYELPSLQKQAQDLGRKCCRAYLDGNWDLQMQKDRDLLCGDIRDLATQIPRDDPVRHLIAIVLKCNEVGWFCKVEWVLSGMFLFLAILNTRERGILSWVVGHNFHDLFVSVTDIFDESKILLYLCFIFDLFKLKK